MALGGEIVLLAHQKKSFHTIKVPQRTTSGETPFRQANSNNALALCFRAESSGLCDMWLPYSTARQPAGLPTSFLELFSFWQRKKWNVSPFQRDEFLQNSVTGKNLIFFTFDQSVPQNYICLFCLEKFSLYKKRPFSAILSSKVSFIRKVRTIYVL